MITTITFLDGFTHTSESWESKEDFVRFYMEQYNSPFQFYGATINGEFTLLNLNHIVRVTFV